MRRYAFTFALDVFKTDLHRSEACASQVQSPDIAVKNIFQRSLDTRQDSLLRDRKLCQQRYLASGQRVPCIFYTIFSSFLGNWFGIFKRDKNSRLLVETFKRKVLLFSYICSIKKVNNMVNLFTLRGIDRSLLPSFFRAAIHFRLAFRLEDFQSRKADFSSLIFLLLFPSTASMPSHVVFLHLSR